MNLISSWIQGKKEDLKWFNSSKEPRYSRTDGEWGFVFFSPGERPDMNNRFFEQPILNSPYEYLARHWELDDDGQPIRQIIEKRRRAESITPIPKPRKRKGSPNQLKLVFDEGKGLSTQEQQYDPTPVINDLRHHVDRWQNRPNPSDRQVTPEMARLLQHWRHHPFNNLRPLFCQIEALKPPSGLRRWRPKPESQAKDSAGKFRGHLNSGRYSRR